MCPWAISHWKSNIVSIIINKHPCDDALYIPRNMRFYLILNLWINLNTNILYNFLILFYEKIINFHSSIIFVMFFFSLVNNIYILFLSGICTYWKSIFPFFSISEYNSRSIVKVVNGITLINFEHNVIQRLKPKRNNITETFKWLYLNWENRQFKSLIFNLNPFE